MSAQDAFGVPPRRGGQWSWRKVLLYCAVTALVAACGAAAANQRDDAYNKVVKKAEGRAGYLPVHDVEWNNYNNAQKLYDSPSSIIWCTFTWGNASAPLITVPVAGKLTSSTTSIFSPEHQKTAGDTGITGVPSMSVDGLFHPNPPQYRYGFTPGGQYVDLFNMPTFCTTALTSFQRQVTRVSTTVDSIARAQDQAAQAALARGDHAGAQAALAPLEGK